MCYKTLWLWLQDTVVESSVTHKCCWLQPKQTVVTENANDNTNGHGSGRAKREQAERLANFLVNMIALKLWREENDNDQRQNPEDLLVSMPPLEAYQWKTKAIRYLNSGGGVCDVAGGSGHVSMVRQ